MIREHRRLPDILSVAGHALLYSIRKIVPPPLPSLEASTPLVSFCAGELEKVRAILSLSGLRPMEILSYILT